MAGTCTICRHDNRDEIDRDLMAGKPYRAIAEQNSTSPAVLGRHKNACVQRTLAASRESDEIERSLNLNAEAQHLYEKVLDVLRQAEAEGDRGDMLKAVREARGLLETRP